MKYDPILGVYRSVHYSGGDVTGEFFYISHGEAYIVNMKVDKTWTYTMPEYPPPPADINAIAGDGVVNLSWTAPEGVTIRGYNIYRRPFYSSTYTKLNDGARLYYYDPYMDILSEGTEPINEISNIDE